MNLILCYCHELGINESGVTFELRSKDLNDVKIGVLGQAPAYPVPSLGFVFVSSSVG